VPGRLVPSPKSVTSRNFLLVRNAEGVAKVYAAVIVKIR